MSRAISRVAALLVAGAVLLAYPLFARSLAGDCKCRHPEKGDSTRPGGNEFVVHIEKDLYRTLEGTVVAMGDRRPVEGALVEVFDHAEYLLGENPLAEHSEQKRVAACRTSTDGKFCFRELPPGKYELRSSLGSGWNVTHIYVVVAKKGQAKRIQVEMTLGT